MKNEPQDGLQALKTRLRDSLLSTPAGSTENILYNQAEILDLTFRHLINQGCDRYDGTPHFMAAFRAQNQYRYTLKAIGASKKDRSGNKTSPGNGFTP